MLGPLRVLPLYETSPSNRIRISGIDSMPPTRSETPQIHWPKDVRESHLVDIDFGKSTEQRHLLLTSLGYGTANVAFKAASTMWVLSLESGSAEDFRQCRVSWIGGVADGEVP